MGSLEPGEQVGLEEEASRACKRAAVSSSMGLLELGLLHVLSAAVADSTVCAKL